MITTPAITTTVNAQQSVDVDCGVAAEPYCVTGDWCPNGQPTPGCSTFGCTTDGQCQGVFDDPAPCDSTPSNVCGDSYCGEGIGSRCTCYADNSCQPDSCVTFQAINCVRFRGCWVWSWFFVGWCCCVPFLCLCVCVPIEFWLWFTDMKTCLSTLSIEIVPSLTNSYYSFTIQIHLNQIQSYQPDSLSAGTCDESGANCPTGAGISCEKTQENNQYKFITSCGGSGSGDGPTDAPSGGTAVGAVMPTSSLLMMMTMAVAAMHLFGTTTMR